MAKAKRIMAALISLAMSLSLTVIATTSVSTDELSWLDFDKVTGGWTVKDLSRAASEPAHRVGITTYDTLPEDMPEGVEETFFLPPEVAFYDIGFLRVEVILDGEWEDWAEDDRQNVCIISQNTIASWDQTEHSTDEIIENNVITRPVKMFQKRPSGEITYADYFKVIITTFSAENDLPVAPLTAKVNLLDTNGNLIPLICPDCGESPCICPCADCGERPCVCFCEQCGLKGEECICCPLCGNKECACEPVKTLEPPPPPPPATDPTDTASGDASDTTADNTDTTIDAATVTNAQGMGGQSSASGVPKGGVTLAIIPVIVAASALVITSRKQNKK